MSAIAPISSVRQFSVGMGVSASPEASSANGKSLAESAASALKESSAADEKEFADLSGAMKFNDLSTDSLVKFSEMMQKKQLKIQLISKISSEAAAGFKTLTQQS